MGFEEGCSTGHACRVRWALEQLSRQGGQERAQGLCSLGMERVKYKGAGAATARPSGLARKQPCQQTPSPETARGAATRCTRARVVGGLPARAPSKRRERAGASGRCHPGSWQGSGGARLAPGGGESAQDRGAGSHRCVEGSPALLPSPFPPTPDSGAPTGARECWHAHARLSPPDQAAWLGLGWAQGWRESGELPAVR